MPSSHSVTRLIEMAKAGDGEACRALFERVYPSLVHVARRRLRGAGLVVGEAEDAIAGVYGDLAGLVAGEVFAKVQDRDGLMNLLAVIVCRKALNLVKHERRKTGCPAKPAASGEVVDVVAAHDEPTRLPGKCREFLGGFDDEELREIDPSMLDAGCLELLKGLAVEGDRLEEIVLWRLLGYTDQQIAEKKLGCALRSVERKFRRVRKLLHREANDA